MTEAPSVSYSPTDDQDLIRETARQFLDDRMPMTRVRELMMSEEGFDRGFWKETADLGWTGLSISERHGGAGLGPVEQSVLLEEMGARVVPGPFFASCVLATTAIQEVATEQQRAAMLPELASGERIATLAMFERRHGWEPGSPTTTASFHDGRWALSGEKRSVLDGHVADVILVTAATPDGVGLFRVEAGTDGLTTRPTEVLDPTRRQATMVLDRVSVPADALLGEGDSLPALRRALSRAVSALAVEQVGGAQRCLDMAVAYAKTRHQFGRPIGSFQAIKHRCARMLMRVESARSVAYHAVRVADRPEEMSIAGPLAGSVTSEAYNWVAGENIQVHGGIGFTWEHDAHLYLKRAKSSSLLLGSPSYHRDRLGRALDI